MTKDSTSVKITIMAQPKAQLVCFTVVFFLNVQRALEQIDKIFCSYFNIMIFCFIVIIIVYCMQLYFRELYVNFNTFANS